ncbi:uncharacterized protein LOC131164452 [Malania oleifera]|uniref:uncharacterized protein LOC131164452 n=1 Tax=Malania oleifera TaxID=397392 RepID=UPI0025AD9E78|nr:uncharacterized protein LOC131164452 [Malania oleifera]
MTMALILALGLSTSTSLLSRSALSLMVVAPSLLARSRLALLDFAGYDPHKGKGIFRFSIPSRYVFLSHLNLGMASSDKPAIVERDAKEKDHKEDEKEEGKEGFIEKVLQDIGTSC